MDLIVDLMVDLMDLMVHLIVHLMVCLLVHLTALEKSVLLSISNLEFKMAIKNKYGRST